MIAAVDGLNNVTLDIADPIPDVRDIVHVHENTTDDKKKTFGFLQKAADGGKGHAGTVGIAVLIKNVKIIGIAGTNQDDVAMGKAIFNPIAGKG